MIGMNVPGMTQYSQLKKKQPPPPPAGQPLVKPTVGSAGAASGQTPGPGLAGGVNAGVNTGMGGYVNQVAQNNMNQQPAGGVQPKVDVSQVGNPGQAVTQNVNPPPPPPPIGQIGPEPPTPKAGEAGSTLQDPGQIHEAGKLYEDRVVAGLKGEDPTVKNAQQTEDTAAARRDYQSRMSTQESLAQTPFAQGSAQYQRAMDRSQAGVDQANQQGQAGVNEYTRRRTEDNMNRARDVGDAALGRAVGERTYSDNQASNLLSTLPEGKAKTTAARLRAEGRTPAQISAALYGADGKLKPDMTDLTPAEADAAAALNEVTSKFRPGMTFKNAKGDTETVPGTSKDDPLYTQWAQQRADERNVQTYGAKGNPINSATTEAEKQRITGDINAGTLDPKDYDAAVRNGLVPRLSSTTLKFGQDAKSLINQLVSIDGKMAKVKSSGNYALNPSKSDRSGYVELEIDGKTYFADSKGNWFNEKPTDKKRESHTNRGKLVDSPFPKPNK